MTTVITDPVFLTEPLVRSQTWVLDPDAAHGPRYLRIRRRKCRSRRPDYVPSHLPGTNPFLHEVADWYGLPNEVTRGGAETMYPEYRKKMPKPEHPKQACERYCDCGMRRKFNACLLSPRAALRENDMKLLWILLAGAVVGRVAPLRNPDARQLQTHSRCRATSICSPARAATSPCRSARRACCWWIRAWRRRGRKRSRRSASCRRAGVLHHQHARASRSRGRQRSLRQSTGTATLDQFGAAMAISRCKSSRTKTC